MVTAVAIIVGVGWQIIGRLIHNVFRPSEYFAFFTILTSMFAHFGPRLNLRQFWNVLASPE